MKLKISIWCMLVASVTCYSIPDATPLPGYTQISQEQVRHLQNRGFGETQKTFTATEAYNEDEYYADVDSAAQSSQDRSTYAYQNYPADVKVTAQPNYNYPSSGRASVNKGVSEKRPSKQQYLRKGEELQAINKLEEEKEEEPDRLTQILPQSKFSCSGRHTGYYADEGLGCEVFHYCQEGARHSWICPDGFSFHQVHLICMPPGADNICEKSSDYHFVNDYLYKPINLEEYQQKPNVTLRYSDRYYPEEYRPHYDEDETPIQHQHSIRVNQQHQRQQYVIPAPTRTQNQQVYRSPEEINISLQQRRPQQQQQYETDY